MTVNELENGPIASKATLNELLKQIKSHIQVRDEKIYEVNKLVSMVKDQKRVSIDNFIQLREEINHLTVEYTKINEISSYIKGFTACYKQVGPLMQDLTSVSSMIEKQEEQLKELSTLVMSPGLIENLTQNSEQQ
ncbi:hypothetical protein KQI58_17630 [Enterococcus raffinosus]|uniref:hypothetical protein n=1 Tax=Enterococcus raffinosus TaxID=71452 RepID=UPI001C0FBD92|nr:hypothetical protein [Enterococcus raffinosus]MBU5362874.1 hypothetical protein [Enterococcus raffinosus]